MPARSRWASFRSDTRLTPRPEQIPAWADYDDRYKPVARRLMEVYAGFLAHTDAQIGRVIDAIDELGQWDNTLFIYVCGDNGASAEGTMHGAWSSPAFQNGLPEDPEWLLAHMADFGTARCENHYNVGWAWALDAPFQWMKQVASHFGGTRNGLAISWPRGIKAAGEQRSQFHHVIDIVPTILDATGVEMPARVNGVEQKPIEGVSMRYSFDDAAADSRRTTQYFEIFGNRAVYHEGWIASCFHGRLPWIRTQRSTPVRRYRALGALPPRRRLQPGCGPRRAIPGQARRVEGRFRRRSAQIRRLPAQRRDAGPRAARQPAEPARRSHLGHLLRRARAHPRTGDAGLHQHVVRTAGAVADSAGRRTGSGDLHRRGDGRVELYLHDGIPHFAYNYLGHELTTVAAAEPLPEGPVALGLSFDYDGGGLGKGASVSLHVNDTAVASGRIERTVPFRFSMSGETLDVGTDTGSPVAPYGQDFRFTGRIDRIDVTVHPQPADLAAAIAEAEMRAALAAQ